MNSVYIHPPFDLEVADACWYPQWLSSQRTCKQEWLLAKGRHRIDFEQKLPKVAPDTLQRPFCGHIRWLYLPTALRLLHHV